MVLIEKNSLFPQLRRRELLQSKKPAAQQSDGSAAPLSAVNAVRPMKKLTQYGWTRGLYGMGLNVMFYT